MRIHLKAQSVQVLCGNTSVEEANTARHPVLHLRCLLTLIDETCDLCESYSGVQVHVTNRYITYNEMDPSLSLSPTQPGTKLSLGQAHRKVSYGF